MGDPVLLRLNGDTPELSEASPADPEQLIGLFVSQAAISHLPIEFTPLHFGEQLRQHL